MSEDKPKFVISPDYQLYSPKPEGVYPVPESDWERVKRMVREIIPVRSWFQAGAATFFGVFVSALFALISFSQYKNVPSWALVTTLSGLVVGLVLAVALFFLDQQALVVVLLASGPPPDRRAGRPQKGAILGVDRQRRMDEEADVRAIADPAKAALAPGLGLIIDLARVLDQKDVPAGRCGSRPLRRRAQDFIRRHSGVAEEAGKPDLLRPIVGQFAQARADAHAHPLQRLPPLFSSRTSPKYPMFKSAIADPLRIKGRPIQNHTRFSLIKEENA